MQYSAASEYYRERFNLFVGTTPDQTIERLMVLVKRALEPAAGHSS